MDIVHLQYFQVLAQEENMTRAAERLHISQPALSASLSKLEKELGIQLFDRIGRHIQLNRNGKIYIDYVNQAMNNLNNAARELDNYNRQEKLTVTLSVVSVQAVQELLSDFQNQYPNITVRKCEIMPRDVFREIHSGDCDFVVAVDSGDCREADCSRVIKREKLYLAVNKNHSLAKRKKIVLPEVKDEPFISLPEGYSFREITEDLCRQAGFQCNILYECFHCSLLNYVCDGAGVAIVTEGLRRQELQRRGRHNNQLAFLELSDPIAYRNVILLWNQDRVLSSAAKLLLEYAENYYRDKKDGKRDGGV